MKGFPNGIVEIIRNCMLSFLHLTELKYRAPLDLVFNKFKKGTVKIVGDAMHATCPFIAQGGSAFIEDALVLPKCLTQKKAKETIEIKITEAEEEFDQYIKERKMRNFWLSLRKIDSWDLLHNLAKDNSLLWCMIGHFSDMLTIEDKYRGQKQPQWLISGFREVVKDCKLVDLPLEGYQYTWIQKRGTMDVTKERLSEDSNHEITRPFLIDEFREALFNMNSDKASCPDKFNPTFYKRVDYKENIYMKILSLYEKAYGQAISLAKSKVFFSRNTPPNIKDEVTSILGVLRY
ncbi:hypothetical protein JHK85_010329 [Glycine max]|nr:hypothetical protein JHK85_010329 [Glycine max]